jgi:Txe/YoeB family toxin of toxin-antitoxin system
VRVVIGEDLFLLREGLVRLLESYDFEVVATAGTAPGLLDALLTHRPDVAVVDVRMPPGNTDDGLRAAIEARRQLPGLPVLVLSQYVEQLYARELLADQAGAVGYLLKDRVFTDDQFATSIRTVAEGGTVVDPEVVQKLLARHVPAVAKLTPRELEVLALMAEGRTNAAIGKRINQLIEDVKRNGNEGIGKPEPLKHGFQGYWSRRITDEHRLVYKIADDEIRIAACRYHYER